MSFRHNFPSPLVVANNPWTRGLKFFSTYETSASNSTQGVVFTDMGVLPLRGTPQKSYKRIVSTTGYPGIGKSGTDSPFVIWEDTADTKFLNSVSAVGRWFPRTSDLCQMCGTLNNTGSTREGWSLTLDNADNFGPGMFAYHNSTNFFVTAPGPAANYFGFEWTFGGVYNANLRQIKVFKDGRMIASGSNNAQAWNSVASGIPLRAPGPWPAGSFPSDCDVYWLAIFDRALTDAEMVVWQTQDPLELILPETPTLGVGGLPPPPPPAGDGLGWLFAIGSDYHVAG